ncbi:MAG: hypothetical protein Q9217_001999 [Psora testacea]
MAPSDELRSPSLRQAPEDSLVYYKSQYEQLEAELADFRASSKELEAELEKDVEAAEKRERQLQEKVEALGYEVEEWKMKYKQSKIEANTAQSNLQKEITSLRDTNRSIQSKLRDIEVSNDNFERQARNTTSSLEDLESKYNIAIERGVMAEEEIKVGEQEREALRIETQRLRDDLSDLKIEAEIRQDKLRKAEAARERLHRRKPSPIVPELGRPQSVLSELSPTTSNSSPTIATPPTKSASSVSETPTPPSPPASEKSNPASDTIPAMPLPRSRLSTTDTTITPRPSLLSSRPRHSRGPSTAASNDRTPHMPRRMTLSRPDTVQRPGLPHSGSLHHLHGLMSKMQLLEQRVHSVRSKLPAPSSTPPRASPRSTSASGQSYIPATVTMRSNKKRTGGSNASSTHAAAERPSSRLSSVYSYGVERPTSRLSCGVPQPSPTREPYLNRPPSRDALSQRPPSCDPHNSRPSSRASLSSRQSISHLASASISSNSRPASRQSISGARTPMGHHSITSRSESRGPRSSMGASYGNAHGGHGHSSSVNKLGNHVSHFHYADEEEYSEVLTPTPSRRGTFTKAESGPSIPALATGSIKSRPSGLGVSRRISSGGGDMGPPERKGTRKLSEVGESY